MVPIDSCVNYTGLSFFCFLFLIFIYLFLAPARDAYAATGGANNCYRIEPEYGMYKCDTVKNIFSFIQWTLGMLIIYMLYNEIYLLKF
jgi:hypothetical protein